MREVRTYKKRIRLGFDGIVNSQDEAVLGLEYAKSCQNFAFEKGVINGKIGVDTASGYYAFPSVDRHAYPTFASDKRIVKTFHYRKILGKTKYSDDRLVAILADGSVWYTTMFSEASKWTQLVDFYLTGDVEGVSYNYKSNDVLLMSSSDDGLFIVNDSTVTYCTNAPKFTSIAVHNERVFGTVNGVSNQVWFSDDFDPANWKVSPTEAGYISFADDLGKAIKVVSFLNYLYVFRDYGIFRLTAYGDQNDFIMKKVFTDTGRIYKDTIVLCGDSIIFLAEDGLYAFNGYETTRIGKELPQISGKNKACGGYLDGNYFLSCSLKDESGNLVGALVRYDLKTRTISLLMGVQITGMCPVKVHNGSCLVFTLDGDFANRLGQAAENGKVFSTATKKVYKSPENILSAPSIKTVRSVSFVSKYPLTLRLVADGKKSEYKVQGKNEMQTVACEKSGSVISFEIETNEQNAYVSPLIVTLDVTRGQV